MRKLPYLVFFLGYFFQFQGYGQNSYDPSVGILALANGEITSEAYLESFFEFRQQYRNQVPDSTLQQLERLQKQFSEAQDLLLEGITRYHISLFHMYTSEKYEVANKNLVEGLEKIQASSFPKFKIPYLFSLSVNYYQLAQHDKALNTAHQLLEITNAPNLIRFKYIGLNITANILLTREATLPQAKNYYKKALQIAQSLNNPSYIASSYFSLANTELHVNNNKKALILLDSSEFYLLKSNPLPFKIAHLLLWKADAQTELEMLQPAIANYKAAIEIYDRQKRLSRRVQTRLKLAETLVRQQAFQEASSVLDEILILPEYKMQDAEWRNFYSLRSKVYKQLGQHQKALNSYEKYVALADSINYKQNLQKVANIEAEYQSVIKENKIAQQEKALLAKEKQSQLLIFIGLFLFLALVGTLGILQFLRKNQQKLTHQNKLIENQAATLKGLDQMKSRFFANVSHELRTPITLILSPLDKILKSQDIPTKHFASLKLMQQSGHNLLKLVNEILDLSKLESGKLILQEEAIVFYPFIRRLISVFESYAQKKGIDLTFEYKAASQLQIKLDKNKFEKIINNLLSNAIKFTPEKGQILITLDDLENVLQLSVKDTGRGIHSDDLPNIFNRFYQSKQPKATAEGGTGIGLALVNEYVKLLGGSIQVTSEVGKGSQFIIQMPKKEVIKALDSEDAMQIEQLNNKGTAINEPDLAISNISTLQLPNSTLAKNTTKAVILYVEDNQELQGYVQKILSENYQIITAENGAKALDFLSNQKELPDLILSDVMMPIMDGFQLLEKLKTSELYQTIPIIMLTARAEMQDKLKALRIGVDDYLQKPFIEAELFARIENLLQNRKNRQTYITSDIQERSNQIEETQENGMGLANQAWLQAQESLLQKHLDDSRLNVNFWASQSAMSERQLQRKIKQLTGLTPQQYLKEFRLNQARQFLENGTYKTIAELAYSLGYTNAQTFSRNYKKRFGKLPSHYFE